MVYVGDICELYIVGERLDNSGHTIDLTIIDPFLKFPPDINFFIADVDELNRH